MVQASDLIEAIRFVTPQLIKGYKLFIWLLRLVIKASNPNNQEHFKYVHMQFAIMLEGLT